MTDFNRTGVQGFGHYEARRKQLKYAVDQAALRVKEAEPKLNEAREAAFIALATTQNAFDTFGNVAISYRDLTAATAKQYRENPVTIPACTEELDAAAFAAVAEFVAARKEYDEAVVASREANRQFGQHEGTVRS